MASYEIPDPVTRKTYKAGTGLKFDITKPNGNDSAGKDLAVSLASDGTVVLAADGARVMGKLLLVQKGDTCAVQTGGLNMAYLQSAASSCTVGRSIVGAGSGKVKNAPQDSVANNEAGRGVITEIESNTVDGIVRVDFI